MELVLHPGSADGWATLIVKSFPFIVGNSEEDVSWECPCGRSLGVGLSARQLLDLLVECGECARVLESPRRAPGEPIPGRPVYLPPGGRYLLGGVLDVADKPVALVGRDALVGYARETGRLIPDIYDPGLAPTISALGPESLLGVASRLRDLLGDEYESLRDSDEKGRLSKTPPAARHRILELIDFARDSAARCQDLDPRRPVEIDGNLLAESLTVLAVAWRWRHHPAWPVLRASLASDGEAPHTTMLLTVASYLADAGNGVGIHTNTARQKVSTADIWLEPDLSQRVDLEVKTPIALRGPKASLSEPQAIVILERALKKSGRQRRNTRSNFLVIGGFHLGATFDVVLSTARAMLVLERRRWRTLGGIIVADCGFEAHQSADERSQAFSPAMRVEIALHPGYVGDVSVDVRGPALAPTPSAVQQE